MPSEALESPTGMGLLTLPIPFSVQAFVPCSAWGMKCPAAAGAYRRITPQRLGLPLFSALSLHIKPPRSHRFHQGDKEESQQWPLLCKKSKLV